MLNIQRILKIVDLGAADDSSLIDCLTLATKLEAEVHLLHVVAEHAFPRFGSHKRMQQAQDQLTELVLPVEAEQVMREVREGPITQCVVEYVREHEIDLVMIDQAKLDALSAKSSQAVVDELRDQLSIPLLLTSSTKMQEAELVSRAAHRLVEVYGRRMEGERAGSEQEMLETLQSDVGLTTSAAQALFEDLQSKALVRWREANQEGDAAAVGHWQLSPVRSGETALNLRTPELELETTPAVSLIQRAIETNATDVHIDPVGEQSYTVQFRVDGRMQDFCRLQRQVAGTTMKQIKLMANISLADPFHPCESRLQMPASIPGYEVRVTTAPVANGEAMALRLINCDKLNLPLNELGLSPQAFASVHRMLHQRSGLILAAGPTGAGKTTTAYSIIHVLYAEHQKIISIEDPVELVVPYIRQISVDTRHDFSMRQGLSTILRMDPDAVFVGEIRDAEAAHVAFQAAACGKRSFSTIHMRDVAATLSAMREFNIDSKTLADNLSGVIAQRLVRRICQECCQHSPLTRHEQEMFASQNIDPPAELARPRGCPACRGSGYQGRIGIFETVIVEGDIADAIRREVHETEMRRLLGARGVSLVADGLLKVREGITTTEELQETSWLVDSFSVSSAAAKVEKTYERAVPG